MAFHHQSVLLAEVLEYLAPAPGRAMMDGTLGGGGHSEALLEAGARVVGCDRDPEALAAASLRLAKFGDMFEARHANFDAMAGWPAGQFDGVLLDLGVSSHQLDTPGRGFSFRAGCPLDMRMDPGSGPSAADLLNGSEEEDIVRWLREYGEEPRARALGREIVRRRASRPFASSLDLVEAVERICGARGGRSHHPATRIFQALRIAVNDELGSLGRALAGAVHALKPGGRLAVISFHSLEDRMVKNFMRECAREFEDTPAWPNSVVNPRRSMKLVTRKAVCASETEADANPRSRSAKLRVAEKLHEVAP